MLATQERAADGLIRALHTLTATDIGVISAVMAGAPSIWSVDRHVSCSGHLLLLLTRNDNDLTLIVQRDGAGFQLAVMREERIAPGALCYPDLGALTAALRALTNGATR